MSYNIKTISNFDNNLKRLSKKYNSIKDDVKLFGNMLASDPRMGTELFANCYKIRLPIASKNKGKRSGARIITYVYVENKTVYLLSIYDKSQQDNISKQDLQKLIESIDF